MIKIDKFFAPKPCAGMMRLGSRFDGGYVLPQLVIDNASVLISLGVNDDWNLEKDFRRVSKEITIHCFDGSIRARTFLMRAAKALLKFRLALCVRYCRVFLDYHRFFKNGVTHYTKFISDRSFDNYIDWSQVEQLVKIQGQNAENVVLKIDIEGEEYRLLEAILDRKDIFSCIMLEFHDFDLHHGLVKEFSKNLGLDIVNFHANNCAPLSKEGVPRVVEITYVSRNFVSGTSNLSGLNSPCCPDKGEYEVIFE